MHCPYCRNTDTRVLDSRVADDGGAIRRRRSCNECGKRFSTVEQMQLVVVKRSGATEPFTREKADRRRPQGLQGPPGLRGRPGLPRPAGRGRAARRGLGRGARPRGRDGHPGAAARARRGGLPPVRAASTAPSSRPTTSRPRSRSCAPSARSTRDTGVEPVEPVDTPASARTGADPQTARGIVGKLRSGHTTSRDSGSAATQHPRTASTTTRHADEEEQGMTETVSGAAQVARQRGRGKGAQDRAGVQHRGRAPLRRDHLGASRRRPDRTGRPARPSSSSAASSSPTSGRSTPPRSSPRSTSAARSAPTCASGASSSSSTGS